MIYVFSLLILLKLKWECIYTEGLSKANLSEFSSFSNLKLNLHFNYFIDLSVLRQLINTRDILAS